MRFKNFTLLLGAFFMLAASSQAANVALGKKVYASSNQQPPELAVDDNLGTRWESKASDGDNQWFYVDLEKGTVIDHLKIVWEGAYGKHYKIHVADEITDEMALKLTDDDKTNDFATGWTEIAEINKTLSGFPASETIAVSTTDVVARYVAVELIERGLPYGFSFWEFGVYDKASKLSSIEITADKLEGSVADTYTLGYKFLDQYKMDYILTAEENASRQMIVSEGATLDGDKITVSSRGTYTVKMKIGDIESNELKIDVKAEGANLALKKDIVFATKGSKNPGNAVDGNLGSLWITDEPSGVENHEYDAVLVVDLGETYDVNCVHTSCEGASSADYTITFSTDNVTFSDPVPAFTVTNGIGMTNRHDWLTSEEAVKARYVKFHSTRAATQYGTKLYELEVTNNEKINLEIQEKRMENKITNKLMNTKITSDKLLDTYKKELIFASDLFAKNPSGVIIGATAIILDKNGVELLIEGQNPEYALYYPNYLTKWYIIEKYAKNGAVYFDLNAITGYFADDSKYKGLNEMKLGYGAEVTEYIGEFDLVIKENAYKLYCKSKLFRNLIKRKTK